MDHATALQKLINCGLSIGEPEAIADIQDFMKDYSSVSYTQICILWKEYTLASTMYGAACLLKYQDEIVLNEYLDNFFIQHCQRT